ncbi:lipoate--protein ligase family protein [Candidatus Bipolaricaulota bacterium]|nr:lipoate--protein ligase family protein [Candidatus Bipolaricaulota bacterium]
MNSKTNKVNNGSALEDRVRVIKDLELRDPAMNIGLEEAIVEAVSGGNSIPTIRFWRNGHSAIIGRSQEAEVEIDIPNCRAAEIPVIRRPTGGGAVLHHPSSLNYSIYLPEAPLTSVEKESIEMTKPVSSAVSEFGLDTRVLSNGLFVGSTKIGGTAQSRREGLLHHGTLLVHGDDIIKEMASFLRAGHDNYGEAVTRVSSKPDPVSNLDSLVKGRVRTPELVQDMTRKIADALGRRPVEGHITTEEWEVASYLARAKYSSPAWNFRFNGKTCKRELETGNGGTT